jgi:hypothetical protein
MPVLYYNGLIELEPQSGVFSQTPKCKELLTNMKSVKEIINFMLGIVITEPRTEFSGGNLTVDHRHVKAEKFILECCLIRAKELMNDLREIGPSNKYEHIFKSKEHEQPSNSDPDPQ